MTDPKLVEKASDILLKHGWDAMQYPECVKDFADALQSHGDEVRRKTVEECVEVAKETRCGCPLRQKCCADIQAVMSAEALLKLLEVKNA